MAKKPSSTSRRKWRGKWSTFWTSRVRPKGGEFWTWIGPLVHVSSTSTSALQALLWSRTNIPWNVFSPSLPYVQTLVLVPDGGSRATWSIRESQEGLLRTTLVLSFAEMHGCSWGCLHLVPSPMSLVRWSGWGRAHALMPLWDLPAPWWRCLEWGIWERTNCARYRKVDGNWSGKRFFRYARFSWLHALVMEKLPQRFSQAVPRSYQRGHHHTRSTSIKGLVDLACFLWQVWFS